MKETHDPLRGLRILELGGDVSTAFAGWWLAELGATVHTLGDRRQPSSAVSDHERLTEQLFERHVARRKQSVTLPSAAAHPVSARGAAAYDVVIGDESSLAQLLPQFDGVLRSGFSIVEITSPEAGGADFGHCLVGDMLLWARSGLAFLTRELEQDAGLGAPCILLSRQASLLTGMAAAIAAVSIALERVRQPHAQRRVSVDKLEMLAALPIQPIAFAQIEGRIVGAAETDRYPGGVVQAANGPVYVRPVEPAHWHKLFALVGGLDWVTPEMLAERRFLVEARAIIDAALAAWVGTQSK